MRIRIGFLGAALVTLVVFAPVIAGADTITTMTTTSVAPASGEFLTADGSCSDSVDCTRTPGALVSLLASGTDTSLADITFDEPLDQPSGRNAVMITAPSLFAGSASYPRGTMVALTNLIRRDAAGTSVAPSLVSPTLVGSVVSTAAKTNGMAHRFEHSSAMATPEPASMLLIGMGLLGTAAAMRRRKSAA